MTTSTQEVQVAADEILSGDWWFIRRQKIPLSARRVEANRKASEAKKLPVRAWDTHQKLGELSDKAARLCTRQLTTLLAGVNGWLHQLQATEVGHEPIAGKNLAALRERLDIPQGKPWSRRLAHAGTEYWTPDLTFKLAILRRQRNASPDILDWAMHHTYLVQTQGELAEGTIPLNLLLYCACALEFCTHFRPLEITPAGLDESSPVLLDGISMPTWRSNAIERLRRYRYRSIALLSQKQLRQLEHLLRNEPQVIFSTARSVSQGLVAQFDEWGVSL